MCSVLYVTNYSHKYLIRLLLFLLHKSLSLSYCFPPVGIRDGEGTVSIHCVSHVVK